MAEMLPQEKYASQASEAKIGGAIFGTLESRVMRDAGGIRTGGGDGRVRRARPASRGRGCWPDREPADRQRGFRKLARRAQTRRTSGGERAVFHKARCK